MVSAQREGDDCVAALSGGAFQTLEEFGLQLICIGVEFAGGNLLRRCALKTQLANAKTAFGAHWRPENSACHGTRRVQVAHACLRIQHRTGLIVGKRFELRRILGDHTRRNIPGKIRPEAANGSLGAFANPLRALGITLFEFGQTLLQAKSVELADRKDTDTALCAARTAGQPRSAPADRVGKCGVDDLHQLAIPALN